MIQGPRSDEGRFKALDGCAGEVMNRTLGRIAGARFF